MTNTGGHPLDDVLAEYAEGVLEGAQARGVEAHLGSCQSCRDTLADLAEVTHMLQRAPSTLPIPAEVRAQLRAALKAETTVVAADPEAAATVVPLRRSTNRAEAGGPVAWFRRRLPQTLAAAASLAVLGFAAYVVTAGGPNASDQTTAGQAEAGDSALSDAAPPAVDADTYAADERADQGEDGHEAASSSDVSQRITDVWRGQSAYSEGCGQALADEQNATLVGSSDLNAEVLVVLQNADATLTGWRLPTCSDLAAQAVGEPVTVPVPAN